MSVWKRKRFYIPGIVGVFVPGSKVDEFSFVFGGFNHFFDQMVVSFVLKDDGYR